MSHKPAATERSQLLETLRQNGHATLKDQAFGSVDGYSYRILLATNKIKTCSVVFSLDEQPDKDTQKQLKELFRTRLNAKRTQFSAKTLTVELAPSLTPFPEALSAAAQFLRECGIPAPSACALCGEGECDGFVAHQGGYRPVHQACLQHMRANLKEQAEEQPGNYLTGAVGALLGCIVGCIPNVLSIWFAERIYALLFALIPLCTYWGYKLFKGKPNKISIVITILFSIVGVFLIEFAILNLALVEEYAITMGESLSFTLSLLGEGEFWGLLLEDSLDCLLFALLGIFIVWGQISRTAKSELRSAESLLSTVTLKPGVQPLSEEASASPQL